MSDDKVYTVWADLYDAAFDWDVRAQVAAIGGLAGVGGRRVPEPRVLEPRVLEPMCGSARMLRAFAKDGYATIGVDASNDMLALARARYAKEGLAGDWLRADVTDFDLDDACDLAICPVNSLAHLPSEDAMEAHLNAMSRNLFTGASYFVQLDLKQPGGGVGLGETWEFEYRGETVRFRWECLAYADGFETHLSRYTFPDGRTLEETYPMKSWTYDAWSALLRRTRFELSGAYTHDTLEPLPRGRSLEGVHVFWMQLVKS
jgi:SAM-dependent methyltransferase